MEHHKKLNETDLYEYFIRHVWKWLAPSMPLNSFEDYLKANQTYRDYLLGFGKNKNFGIRNISPEEAKAIPDNSERFDNISFSYKGFSKVESMIEQKLPVALISWHHGALHHIDYSITRILPQVAIFSLWTFQYGKVFSYSMVGNKALSLVKMNHFLNDGRPILYYMDGPPVGESVRIPALGIKPELSTAPINVIRNVDNIRIVPVTSYYGEASKGAKVTTTFHDPVPHPEMLKQMTDRDVLAALISHFEKDIVAKAPAQILIKFMISRQQIAAQINAEQASKKRKHG